MSAAYLTLAVPAEVKARLDAYRRSRLLPSGRGHLSYGDAILELLDLAREPVGCPEVHDPQDGLCAACGGDHASANCIARGSG